MRVERSRSGRTGGVLGAVARLGFALILISPLSAFAQADHTTKVRWNADTTAGQVPPGRTCTLEYASFDTNVKSEGTASMK